MFVDATTLGPRLARLSAALERWTAEYPAILGADAERARHHLEAIADLQAMIHQLGAISALPSEPVPSDMRTVPTPLVGTTAAALLEGVSSYT